MNIWIETKLLYFQLCFSPIKEKVNQKFFHRQYSRTETKIRSQLKPFKMIAKISFFIINNWLYESSRCVCQENKEKNSPE